jgi:hypothetical protein
LPGRLNESQRLRNFSAFDIMVPCHGQHRHVGLLQFLHQAEIFIGNAVHFLALLFLKGRVFPIGSEDLGQIQPLPPVVVRAIGKEPLGVRAGY